jgi:hypothetical protein
MIGALLRISVTGLIASLTSPAYPAYAVQCGGGGYQLKEPALCSKLFVFSGTCGRAVYPYPGWPDVVFAVGAWEAVPIRVTSVSVDALVRSRWWRMVSASIFAGNSFNADPMTPYRNATSSAFDLLGRAAVAVASEQHFPLDDAMQFPAGQPMPQVHLDAHLTCSPNGASYSGSLSVWYRLDP